MSVVREPFAFRQLHLREHRAKRGILRAASVNAEPDLPLCFRKVANPHLVKDFAVLGTFDAKIIFAAA